MHHLSARSSNKIYVIDYQDCIEADPVIFIMPFEKWCTVIIYDIEWKLKNLS